MHIIDYVIIGMVSGMIAYAITVIIKNKKKGRCSGCSGDCSSCKYQNEGDAHGKGTKK